MYNIKCNAASGYSSQDSVTIYVESPVATQPPAKTYTPPANTYTHSIEQLTGQSAGQSAASCDSTATAIVNAAGGCSNIDSATYPNVYAACCRVITKDILLQLLDTALGHGMTGTDKESLLDALNSYLSQ